ncbi:MAG: TonB family protein [Myxococcota bacterium]
MARAATSSFVTWEVPASMLVHAALFALVVLARCEANSQPLFRPEDTIVVEMAGPMAAPSAMPQKAERAPEASKGADAVAPPPPNPSDMAYRTPDAPQVKGDASAERQRLIDEMKRRALLEGLDDAPEGEVDRAASGEAGDGGPIRPGKSDPELARWVRAVRDAVGKNWHPIAAQCAQELDVVIKIDLDGTGAKTGPAEVAEPSGNTSFDAAAMRAVEQTASLPTPPPRFAETGLVASVRFQSKECR